MSPIETERKSADKRPRPQGVSRAAMLLISLGTESAAEITKYLAEEEIEKLSAEIISLGSVDPEEKNRVIEQFYETTMARKLISEGGESYARKMLTQGLGERRANAILGRFRGVGNENYFGSINNVDPETIANFLKKEHPQTTALVLSTLSSRQAGQILTKLPEEVRTSVVYRMATIERPSAEVIKDIQEVLSSYMKTDFQDLGISFGGTTQVAETFNEIEQSVWKNILEEIEDEDPDIAEEIKNQMFTFGDLILLDNKSVQAVLKEVESKDLALALKGSSKEVQELVYRNMSKRGVAAIKEEMEYMGPVRVSDVEAAQQRIIEVVRNLEAEGQIYIAGRGGEESAFIE